jgi:hypothetical protein
MRKDIHLDRAKISRTLRRVLPKNSTEDSDRLAQVLIKVLQGLQIDSNMAVDFQALIDSLAGHSIATSDALLSFGEGNNLGDVTIGDVANGNITKIHLHLDPNNLPKWYLSDYTDNQSQHKVRLLEIHRSRLEKLEEQAAIFGISCPPHISMEIASINAKIQKILTELR